MVILVLLWGLLHGRGIWGLTGPSEVTVRSGDTISVECEYDEGFQDYIKYWCKGEHFKYCDIQIQTSNKSIYSGRFTIRDTVDNRTLTVTMSNARPEDADIYYCGIERNLGDNRHMVTVRVLPGLCHIAPPWTDIVHFPPNVTEIEDGHVVEVTCQETYKKKNITLRCTEGSGGFVLSGQNYSDYCFGLCRIAPPWTDIVYFPPNVTEIEVGHVVEVTYQETYKKKKVTLRCREGSGGFVLSGQSHGDYCVGVCRDWTPWTDIVDFPENFTEMVVNSSVVVSCQQRYEEKTFRLQCREEVGGFLLSPEDGQGSCVGVCRKSPAWTDIVDFPGNFTEIAVNNSVVVSCQQRYEEKTLRLQCREEAGGFLLSPEDGQGSCVALFSRLRFLLTTTIGFVVPFVLKLVVLLVMLVVKTSCMIKQKLRINRRELIQERSLEESHIDVQQREKNSYIRPPPPTASTPSHRKQEERYEMSPRREEEEVVQEIYENLQDEVNKFPGRNEKPKMPKKH